jgi:hypothetical protein
MFKELGQVIFFTALPIGVVIFGGIGWILRNQHMLGIQKMALEKKLAEAKTEPEREQVLNQLKAIWAQM